MEVGNGSSMVVVEISLEVVENCSSKVVEVIF